MQDILLIILGFGVASGIPWGIAISDNTPNRILPNTLATTAFFTASYGILSGILLASFWVAEKIS